MSLIKLIRPRALIARKRGESFFVAWGWAALRGFIWDRWACLAGRSVGSFDSNHHLRQLCAQLLGSHQIFVTGQQIKNFLLYYAEGIDLEDKTSLDWLWWNQDDLDEKLTRWKWRDTPPRRWSDYFSRKSSWRGHYAAHKFLDELMLCHSHYQPMNKGLLMRHRWLKEIQMTNVSASLQSYLRVWVVQEVAVAIVVRIVYGGKYHKCDRVCRILSAFAIRKMEA
jgi:hypothetical protein